MVKKGGNFFEEHVEKIVLAVGGAVCLWLLVTRVLISPNSVEYGKGEYLGPGRVDREILQQAQALEDKLNSAVEPRPPYEPNLGGFVAKMTSSIPSLSVDLAGLQPAYSSVEFKDNRKYRLPEIGELQDASIEHLRAVAYVPISDVDAEDPYDASGSEPNDLDLVSVEAKFDVARLYESFYESFAGEDVPADWRDPCLAEPVFAALELQRQEVLADGSWSEWETVPRARIDYQRNKFEILEDVNDLPPGGIGRRLYEFGGLETTRDLLQPEAYRIASAEEEWFPPSLHEEYVQYRKKLELEERRQAIQAERKKREQEREEARREREQGRYGRFGGRSGEREYPGLRAGRRGGRFGERDERYGGPLSRRPGRRDSIRGRVTGKTKRGSLDAKKGSGKTAVAKTKSMADFYDEYKECLITKETELAKMQEPLLIWAHDDTVAPGKVCRYRIRIGVLNPIAGTNQFDEEETDKKNNVILWSEFSDVAETVEIPETLYFFAQDIQEAAKMVTMKVYRYALGYWYSSGFNVRPGEVVGKVMEPEIEEDKEEEKSKQKEEITIPETVDYSTGAVYVDAVAMNDWSSGSNMRARTCFDMLYSFDGAGIAHMSIGRTNWEPKLQAKFIELQEAERRKKEPLRGFGARRRLRRLGRAVSPELGMELSEEEREEQAYEEWE